MRPTVKYLTFLVAIELAVFAVIFGSCAAAWYQLTLDEQTFLERIAPRLVPYPLLGALVLLLIVGVLVSLLFRNYVIPILKLGEETRLMSAVNPRYRIEPKGPAELVHLADTINETADAFQALQMEIREKIDQARSDLRAERNRLAALMSKLPTGVLACNINGQVLLYNAQSQRLLQQPGKRIGLGRSIFGILDREAIVHGLDLLHQAALQGQKAPTTNFITTTQDNLCLRINMAPVFQEGAEEKEINGFFLAVEDLTDQMEAELQRDQIFQSFTEDVRHSTARIRQAIAAILADPGQTPEQLKPYRQELDSASLAIEEQVRHAREEYARQLFSAGRTESVLGDYLVEITRRHLGRQTGVPVDPRVAPDIWLQIDSYAMVQGLAHLGAPLHGSPGLDAITLHLTRQSDVLAILEIGWQGCRLPHADLDSWRNQPLIRDVQNRLISFADLIERAHGTLELLPAGEESCQGVRLGLPLSEPGEHFKDKSAAEDRPIYYEFNLFHQPCLIELCKQPLNNLTFAVFDTETTGLHPSQGDEIVQIGAVRIVNGRILYGETIDQLVNPCRKVPEESIRIHGITPELLLDQPTLARVLPEFHHFAEGSVLVAHNAAFDMKFLKIKEAETGLRFEQPVLDTLLLSSIVHPNLEGHGLEQIARRLDIAIVGRHTALGDALVTAEILVKLIPLLEAKGIHTLNDAVEASALSPFARMQF
jgi:DNA polymerase-3 subunit epsilon